MKRLSPVLAAVAAVFVFSACAEQPMFNVGPVPGSAPAAAPQARFVEVPAAPVEAPPPPAPPVEATAPPEAAAAEMGIVGLRLGVVSGGVAVKALQPGSSAAESGVTTGDLVLAVDGDTVGAMTLAQIRRRMRGPAGTTVVVRFQRGEAPPFDRTLQRRALVAVAPPPAAPTPPIAETASSAPRVEQAPRGDNSDVESRLLP
jgi:membrane-associated protease RseP (regulator of RpoE activity)